MGKWAPGRPGVFLDTSYLIALQDADDGNHVVAMAHRERLPVMPPLPTTSYILDEVVTFFNVRGHHGGSLAGAIRTGGST